MNNLTEIISLISTLGAQSKEAFIWYLVIDKGAMLLSLAGGLGTVMYLVNRIVRATTYEQDLIEIRNMLKLGSGGLASYEVQAVKDWVRENKDDM